MQLGKLFFAFVVAMSVSSCAYVDPNIYQPSSNKTTAKQTPAKSTIYIEQYDEDAIEDYMSGLKGVVQFLSAAQSAQSTEIMQGQMLLGLALGQMKTSKIEIEVWPLPDRQKVWNVMGKRMQSYNELVEQESARIIADPGFDEQVKNLVRSIKLIKKDSLLSE